MKSNRMKENDEEYDIRERDYYENEDISYLDNH